MRNRSVYHKYKIVLSEFYFIFFLFKVDVFDEVALKSLSVLNAASRSFAEIDRRLGCKFSKACFLAKVPPKMIFTFHCKILVICKHIRLYCIFLNKRVCQPLNHQPGSVSYTPPAPHQDIAKKQVQTLTKTLSWRKLHININLFRNVKVVSWSILIEFIL